MANLLKFLPSHNPRKNPQAHKQFMNEFLVLPHTRIRLKRNSRQQGEKEEEDTDIVVRERFAFRRYTTQYLGR